MTEAEPYERVLRGIPRWLLCRYLEDLGGRRESRTAPVREDPSLAAREDPSPPAPLSRARERGSQRGTPPVSGARETGSHQKGTSPVSGVPNAAESVEDVVVGEGWRATLTQIEDYRIGSLRSGQVRLTVAGEPAAVQAMLTALEPRLFRGGG